MVTVQGILIPHEPIRHVFPGSSVTLTGAPAASVTSHPSRFTTFVILLLEGGVFIDLGGYRRSVAQQIRVRVPTV